MFSTFSQHFHQCLVVVDFLGSIQSLRFYLVLFVSAPLLMATLTASTSWAGSGKRPKRNQFTGCGQSRAEILGPRFHFHRC